MTGEPSPGAIVAALRRGRWVARDEDVLQRAMLEVLVAEFGADVVRREVPLFEIDRVLRPTSIGRIDFVVGDVGLELKVRGSRSDTLRQAQRYLGSPLLSSLVVASTHAALLSNWPPDLAGKRVATTHLRSWP